MAQSGRVQGFAPEIQQILLQKRVGGRRKLKEWLQLLERLGSFDEAQDEVRAKYRGRVQIWIATAVSVGLFLVTFGLFVGPMLPRLLVVLLVFGLVALGVIGYLGFRDHHRLKALEREDLDNAFRQVALPVLQALSEDVARDAKVQLALDMSPLKDPQKIVRQHERKGRFLDRQIQYYSPWFRARLPLRWGGYLVLEVKDHLFQWDLQYRNPRGKMKSKTRYKRLSVAKVSLEPNPSRFQWDRAKVQRLATERGLRLKERGGLFLGQLTLKGKAKGKVKGLATLDPTKVPLAPLKPDDLLALVMAVHWALVPVTPR